MNDLSDNAIDALLRDQFEGPVPIEDFCDRVMDRLPQRRRPLFAQPAILGILAGVVMGWLSLRSASVLGIGWHDWQAGNLSAPATTVIVTMTGISLLALTWVVSESGNLGGEAI